MVRTLYLFPDTNLFFQCKALDQLDWKRFDADTVELIVCRPVTREVDAHKGKGNSRTARRARAAASKIGESLMSPTGVLPIKNNAVDVRFSVDVTTKEDPALVDLLSYTEPDHQLVGIAANFAKGNPGADVRVLTHDNGVMAASRSAGVKCEFIPDDWLEAIEPDERDKQLQESQRQLMRYQKAEPEVQITLGPGVSPSDRIQFELPSYEPLTDADIDKLIEQLKEEIPLETDLKKLDPREGLLSSMRSAMLPSREFKPASSEEIAEYSDQKYPSWIVRCREFFRTLSETLSQNRTWPKLAVILNNIGARPADDVLVVFACEGRFQLIRIDDKEPSSREGIRLPPPPVAPRGHWEIRQDPYASVMKQFERAAGIRFSDPAAALRRAMVPAIPHRDAGKFYYDTGLKGIPSSELRLSCSRWRHQVGDESFVHEVVCPESNVAMNGALRVEVHAANMTNAVIHRFPICISFKATSAFDDAVNLIEASAAEYRTALFQLS